MPFCIIFSDAAKHEPVKNLLEVVDIELSLQFKEVELAYKDHYRPTPKSPPPDYIGAAWDAGTQAFTNMAEHLNDAQTMADRSLPERITFGDKDLLHRRR